MKAVIVEDVRLPRLTQESEHRFEYGDGIFSEVLEANLVATVGPVGPKSLDLRVLGCPKSPCAHGNVSPRHADVFVDDGIMAMSVGEGKSDVQPVPHDQHELGPVVEHLP